MITYRCKLMWEVQDIYVWQIGELTSWLRFLVKGLPSYVCVCVYQDFYSMEKLIGKLFRMIFIFPICRSIGLQIPSQAALAVHSWCWFHYQTVLSLGLLDKWDRFWNHTNQESVDMMKTDNISGPKCLYKPVVESCKISTEDWMSMLLTEASCLPLVCCMVVLDIEGLHIFPFASNLSNPITTIKFWQC